MPCVLTSGVGTDCRDNAGGIEYAYILDATGQDIVVTEAAGVVSAITVGATSITTLSADMFLFDQVRQTANMTETGTFSDENGTVFFSNVANLIFNKLEATKLQQLKLLAQNSKLLVIVKDNNGKFWMIGNDRGAVATSSTAESGTAFGDRNGFSIELTGLAPEPMYEVTVAES
jgi:hypothetical protein